MNAPIGIFGGTFDPIHYGHLRLAQEIAESVRMAEIRLVPAGTPPHRAAPQVSSQQRLDMVRLAAAGNPLFTVDEREVKRSGPGYTVDTLVELRREAGATRPLCMLLGADAFLELATWHRWHELFGLAHLIVAHRPGFPPESWPQRMPQPLA
ncbi:MAG TPA: nicotinate-nucleotide adenylyltransferase, partial [Burkholderiales bacterium]|nr:nicotinate-nucleotide adenylyltransferase [Burkholderiales bacterium]